MISNHFRIPNNKNNRRQCERIILSARLLFLGEQHDKR